MTTAALFANPGLAPFDITGYQGVRGADFYSIDPLLQKLLLLEFADGAPGEQAAVEAHLREYGALCGGVLNDLVEAAHKEGKYGEVVHFDRSGTRIDEVRYCPEQREARRISYEHGLVSLDFFPEWKQPFRMFHRMALAYLANQNGEAGFTCPVAMTDGMIRVLKALGTEEQKARYLPLVAGKGSASHFMCGQYVTERVGGSNVGQNRTVARKQSDGRWILNGEKWFCSNPGDLWVTTARIEDTNVIGMFLVPRIKRDGELNGCRILRKKDIIGSRGKITVETVYEDCEAEELGRPAHGLANMIKYVIQTSRLHVAVAACGMSRRAFLEARAYTGVREAYGRKVQDFPVVLRALAEMQILHSAILATAFRTFTASDSGRAATQLITPLMKYASTVHATWITHEGMMLLGGNGILGDFSILPRLHNDAIINETWEGTHQIIAEHALKAWSRPRIHADFFALIDANLAAAPNELRAGGEALRNKLADYQALGAEWLEANRLFFCDLLYNLFAYSELARLAADGDSVALGLARGFEEIAARGKSGPARPDGVFGDAALLQSIVAW